MSAARTSMATVSDTTWNSATNSATAAGSSLLSFVTGGNSRATRPDDSQMSAQQQKQMQAESWARAGKQFSSPREVYTRSLYRICLKFTTSEDEDEGKPEPSTAYWTVFGKTTTIGNAGQNSPAPDTICRRMDDSMSGPAAGVLSRLTDNDGEQAAMYALRSGMTCGWHISGDRGDAAIRVGKAKVFQGKKGTDENTGREAQILSLDADRWVLCKQASFAAGNSVFIVEDYNEAKQKITVHCTKGPMRGKMFDIHASRCPFVFGRAHEADLCIMDRELSRRHGAILYLPNRKNRKAGTGAFILVDLESTVSTQIASPN